jgi:hypothetical protein
MARQLNKSVSPAFTADDFVQARRSPTSHKELRTLRATLMP